MNSKETAEEDTGIAQSGRLRYFLSGDPDNSIDIDQARRELRAGETLHVPAAGAGSYLQVAEDLELEPVEAWDTSSSAGDWSIRLKAEHGKFLLQGNRFPRYGFFYKLFEDWQEWERGTVTYEEE